MNPIIHSILEKMDMNNFGIGASHLVEVTHVDDPKNFYVRLISLNEDVEFLEERGSRISVEDIEPGELVIYKSKTLRKYVRGIIEVIGEGRRFSIFAMDYGCRDNDVRLRNIYSPVSNMQCPALALHCQLHLCEPKGEMFDTDAIEAMKFFVGKHTARINIIYKSIKKFTVELRTVDSPDDVATMLALLHYTTLATYPNTVNRFYCGPALYENLKYRYKNLRVGDQLCVRVQGGETISSFYVIEVNDYKKYISSKSEFMLYCKKQKMADVSSAEYGNMCCAVRQHSGDYERAIVLHITEPHSKALVKLVDLGKEIEAPFSCIKSVTSEVYTVRPACAIYCSSYPEQMWNNGLPKFLYPGYQFIIQIAEVGNDMNIPHKVNIFPINH